MACLPQKRLGGIMTLDKQRLLLTLERVLKEEESMTDNSQPPTELIEYLNRRDCVLCGRPPGFTSLAA
jgi:hypothetical protein